jgi:hypothetical protein
VFVCGDVTAAAGHAAGTSCLVGKAHHALANPTLALTATIVTAATGTSISMCWYEVMWLQQQAMQQVRPPACLPAWGGASCFGQSHCEWPVTHKLCLSNGSSQQSQRRSSSRPWQAYGFCNNMLADIHVPSIDAASRCMSADVLLLQLQWKHCHTMC